MLLSSYSNGRNGTGDIELRGAGGCSLAVAMPLIPAFADKVTSWKKWRRVF